ncbi:uncharacterized protein J7T54_008022 [Emericellopsis cladophorae]|uniref:Increased recombination centers protein 6 n=1 Tax=Emericellopsis cladophorae TaxID=2686198 RepID=A0A9P9Y8B1_9HYPO|nr:uncharacterized protein J7T54_008022 [Emericellopsis cladophorae]KAI6784928.1 hypothetical protein J7T54_008022 [Emericellopsis cladophorae]
MDISNPRRALALSLSSQAHHLSRVIKDLTGDAPSPVTDSLAGVTHDLVLSTPYYKTTLPIWLDTPTAPADWSASFLSDEAREVLDVLGGVIVVFSLHEDKQETRSLLHEVGKVVKEGLGGWEWDGVGVAVGIGNGDADAWDELCAAGGLEFVQLTGNDQGRNEFGEKMGIARVKEALEANDWASLDDHDAPADFGEFEDPDENGDQKDLDPESMGFGFDRADFEGLRKSIWTSGQVQDEETQPVGGLREGAQAADAASIPVSSRAEPPTTENNQQGSGLVDEDLEKVEKMMRKLQAAREAGEGMSEAQRKRMAARAVEEVMREM